MKVLCLGAGGAASNGFARALALAGGYELVGTNSNPNDLRLSECPANHLVAPASDVSQWRRDIFDILRSHQPDFVHAQSDEEVEALGRFRTTVHLTGAKTYLPDTPTILTCRDKYESYLRWKEAGLTVPKTVLLDNFETLNLFFYGNPERWLRPTTGAGGQKSLRTKNYRVAQAWMWHHNGYGEFTAAECLTDRTVTVQALYWKGKFVCSQQRARESWANAGSTTTGVSGSTGVGVTTADPAVDEIAERAVRAITDTPHGLFGVDMAYDQNGVANPTEINVGRFFTTAPEFFARAGWNMADVYAFCGKHRGWMPCMVKRNPIEPGTKWIRGMDRAPVLV